MRRLLVLLIIVIGTFPRIPLDIALPGRTFDLRAEDVILAGLLVLFLIQLARGRPLARTPVSSMLLAYVGVATLATIIALVAFELDLFRSLLYLAKELEYFLLFVLVINWTKTREDVDALVRAVLAVGVLNAVWFLFQLLIGDSRTLVNLAADVGEGVFVGAARTQSYGPQLLGESSPFAAGSLFMFLFLLALAGVLMRSKPVARRQAVLAVVFFACLLLTLSRVSFVGAIVGAAVLLAIHLKRRRARRAAIGVMLFGGAALLIAGVGVMSRLTGESLGISILERVSEIWAPLWDAFLARPFLGYGKGSLGVVPGLGAGEAHNSYLRLLVETGVVGFMTFVGALAMLLVVNGRLIVRGRHAASRTLAATAFVGTIAHSISALFQDAFVPVLVNEIFWLLAALAWCAYRTEQAMPIVSSPATPTTDVATAGSTDAA